MSYIGVQSQNQISPQFSREVINGDGSATSFTLIQDVPGFNADNIMVVVNNVIQEPVAAYTIKEDANGNPRVLDFGTGNVLSTTDECYVQHRGVGTLNMTPAAGSVNAAALQDNLRSGNVDSFTANAGQTAFTLTETPLNAQSISVFVNGIYQKPTTNFTVATNQLTLTAGAVAGDEIDVIHHTIRTTVTHVADGSVTSGKLDTNIQVAGTLGVTGASTLTGNTTVGGNLTVNGNTTLGNASTDTVTIPGNLTVSGTTTTIDTTVTTSDAMVINNAGSDVGLKVNSTSTGHILQLQDNGTDKVIVADGGLSTFSSGIVAAPYVKITGQSAEPVAASGNAGTLWFDTDDNKLKLSNGTTYHSLNELIMIEFILIGGGGSGGIDRGGGGGAGGYIRTSTVAQRGVTYTINIGDGATGPASADPPTSGENSDAFGYVALGGGAGGTYHGGTTASKLGVAGGSGGGCSSYSPGLGGGGAAGQGNSGGHFNSVSNSSCGGGGGAGGHGDPATSKGGNGGIGMADNWEGSSIYRAGGGGGASSGGAAGTGGNGGGGNGSQGDNQTAGGNATANSGGGGGGATGGSATSGFKGGNGGSGICLVRNLTSLGTATITGSGNTTTTQGTYKLYKFIADGTIIFS